MYPTDIRFHVPIEVYVDDHLMKLEHKSTRPKDNRFHEPIEGYVDDHQLLH